jgi:hypothetical protein
MADTPIIRTFVHYHLPGYKSGDHYLPGYKAGPIRTIANLLERLGDEFEITSDRDFGVSFQAWHQIGIMAS